MGKPKTLASADLQIEHVPIDALRPDPANPRQIADSELEALTRSKTCGPYRSPPA